MSRAHFRALCRRILLALLLWAALALTPWPAGAQTATPLHEAVADGRVSVMAVVGQEFGVLSLVLWPTDQAVMVTLLPGTVFTPDDEGFSPVVSVERIDMLVQDETTINSLPVVSLSPVLQRPLPLSGASYSLDGLAAAPVLELLGRAEAAGLSDAPAVQLAVWAAATGRSPAEVNDGLNVPYPDDALTTAQALVAGLAVPTPLVLPPSATTASSAASATTATTATTTPASGGEDADTSGGPLRFLLLGVVGVVVLAAVIAGATVLGQRKKPDAQARAEARAVTAQPPRSHTNGNRRPQNSVADQRPPTELYGQGSLKLSCTDGPYAGRTFTVTEDTVMSRRSITVLPLSLPGIYAPHVCLYWTADGVEVKDLNSAGGTKLDGGSLQERRFTKTPYGSILRLGGATAVQVHADGLLVNNTHYPAAAGDVILSGKPLAISVLGEGDKSVSSPHCLLLREMGQFAVRDLNSSGGVKVNDKPIGPANTILNDADRLSIGDLTVFVCSLG